MLLTVNDEKLEIEDGSTLEDLLGRFDISAESRGIAVALNESVVPKHQWAATALKEGDTIEIIRAVQGG